MNKKLVGSGLCVVVALSGTLNAAEPPSELGQCAFATLAEIAVVLSEDETTDWNRVDLLALREHLVDMDEVMMRAEVDEQPIEAGVRIHVTGAGRTLDALQRMIPMHSRMMRMTPGHGAWQVDLRERPDGFELDVTTDNSSEVGRLRGLGFFGFLAAGNHHRHHHLGLASGSMMHPDRAHDSPHTGHEP